MDYSAYCSAARGLKKATEVVHTNKAFASTELKSPQHEPQQLQRKAPQDLNLEIKISSDLSKNLNPNPFYVHSSTATEYSRAQERDAPPNTPDTSPKTGSDFSTDNILGEFSEATTVQESPEKETKPYLRSEGSSSWLPEVSEKSISRKDSRAVTKEITNPRVLAALGRHKGSTPPSETESVSGSVKTRNCVKILDLYRKLTSLIERRERRSKPVLRDRIQTGYEVSVPEDEVKNSLSWKRLAGKFNIFLSSKPKPNAWAQSRQPTAEVTDETDYNLPSQETVEKILEINRTPEFYPVAVSKPSYWIDCNPKLHRSISRRCSRLSRKLSSGFSYSTPAPPYPGPHHEIDTIREDVCDTPLLEELQGLEAFYATDETENFFNDCNITDHKEDGKADYFFKLGSRQISRRSSRYQSNFVNDVIPANLAETYSSQKGAFNWGSNDNDVGGPDYNIEIETQSIQSYEDVIDTSSVLIENIEDEAPMVTRNRSLYYMSSNDDTSFNEWLRPRPYRTPFRPLSLVKSVASFPLLFGWDKASISTEEENYSEHIVEFDTNEVTEEIPVDLDPSTPPSRSFFSKVKLVKNCFRRS